MAFAIRLLEEDGVVAEILVMDNNFNPVLKGVDRKTFPIMGSLDPYRDTPLDCAMSKLLRKELLKAEDFFVSTGVAPESVRDLIRLCDLTCAKPNRRLLFIGD